MYIPSRINYDERGATIVQDRHRYKGSQETLASLGHSDRDIDLSCMSIGSVSVVRSHICTCKVVSVVL